MASDMSCNMRMVFVRRKDCAATVTEGVQLEEEPVDGKRISREVTEPK
jgi:hypothetical protein